MDVVEKLVSLGAYSCAGDLILNGKVVANLRSGRVEITEHGAKLAAIEDAAVKPEVRRGRKPKAESSVDGEDNL